MSTLSALVLVLVFGAGVVAGFCALALYAALKIVGGGK